MFLHVLKLLMRVKIFIGCHTYPKILYVRKIYIFAQTHNLPIVLRKRVRSEKILSFYYVFSLPLIQNSFFDMKIMYKAIPSVDKSNWDRGRVFQLGQYINRI